jgi:hypothetical protein
MRCTAAVAFALGLGATASATGPSVLIGFTRHETRFAMTRLLDGAARRLIDPRCLGILDDFTNAENVPLRVALEGQGRSAAGAFGALRFVDDLDAATCATGSMLAFTQRGSRVVHVCSRRFVQRFVAEPAYAELIVIHEFLHSLGLGENPPTTDAITARVKARCGGAGSRPPLPRQ